MGDSDWISISDAPAWDAAVRACGPHDCYHLAGYHRLAAQEGEGQPKLFVYTEGRQTAVLPLLLRRLAEIPGLKDCGRVDAGSVYGYPGLLTTAVREDPRGQSFRAGFQLALREALAELDVTALFVRQNPLILTGWLFDGMADASSRGHTVAIDLSLPEERQVAEMRRDHRYDIRRARRQGAVVVEDPDFCRVDEFRRLYLATMRHAGADDYYFFSAPYFRALKANLGDRVTLMFAQHEGRVVAGAMFLKCDRIIQYHLSGTAPEMAKFRGGTKIVLDAIRAWGARNGYRWLHLGGGLGGRQDSLFEFKSGFSPLRFSFETLGIVIQPERYRRLADRRAGWAARQGLALAEGPFFPEYRRPIVARAG